MNYIDHFLGSRWTYTQRFEPGFIRNDQHSIELIALITPVVIDVVAFYVANRKKILPGIKKLQFCYTREPGELPIQGQKRTTRNIILTPIALAAIATASIGIYILLKKGLIVKGEAEATNFLTHLSVVKDIENFMTKLETKPYVFTGYSLIGVAHSVQAVRQYKASKIRFGKHVVAAIIAFITPIIMAVGIYETRWHHMSYGQLSLLPSLNAVNFFGGMMVLDSMLYWLKPLKDNYDFSDVFSAHMTAFFVQMATLSLFQIVSSRLFKNVPVVQEEFKEEELRLLAAEEAEAT